MRRLAVGFAYFFSLLVSSQVSAQSWVFRSDTGGTAAVSSQNKSTVLVVSCQRTGFGLRIIFNVDLRGWRTSPVGQEDVRLRLGNSVFKLNLSGGDDYVVLYNVPSPDLHIDTELVSVLASGVSIVLEGYNAAQMPLQSRTYSGQGAGAAISRLRANCPSR